ncbi:hypothetical protein YC2023_046093 [Brassica napus]
MRKMKFLWLLQVSLMGLESMLMMEMKVAVKGMNHRRLSVLNMATRSYAIHFELIFKIVALQQSRYSLEKKRTQQAPKIKHKQTARSAVKSLVFLTRD